MTSPGPRCGKPVRRKEQGGAVMTVATSPCGRPEGHNPDTPCRSVGSLLRSGTITVPPIVQAATPPPEDHAGVLTAQAMADLAEQLVPVAVGLAGAVRDEDRTLIGRRLRRLDPVGYKDLPPVYRALIIVLAGMVPDDATAEDLLDWVGWDDDPHAATRAVEQVPVVPPTLRAVS